MEDKSENKNVYPLRIIGLFLGFCEIVVGVAATQISGPIQNYLFFFVMGFPIIIAIAFFLILILRPYVFYPPSEYNDKIKPKDYINALRGNSASPSEEFQPIDYSKQDTKIEVEIVSNQKEINESVEISDPGKEESNNWISLIMSQQFVQARKEILEELVDEDDQETIIRLKSFAAYALCYIEPENGFLEFAEIKNKFDNEFSPYFWESVFFADTKQYLKAIDIINSALEKVSSQSLIKSLKMRKLELLFQSKKYDDTEIFAKEILKNINEPSIVAKVFRILGTIYKDTDRNMDADNAYFSAYKAFPANNENLTEICQYFSTTKNNKLELFFRLEAQKLSPSVTNNGNLGNCYLNSGFNNLAMSAYFQANVLAEGKEAWIVSNIGNLYNNIGLYDLAIEYLSKGLELDPDSQYIHERLAASMKKKEIEKAQIQEILDSIEAI
jgi:tetratricopeptide (TPR) repeat protein